MSQDVRLDVALEAALLAELRRNYEWENWARFAKRLTAPVIALTDSRSRLGQWVRATRRLELSRTLVVERPWPEVVSVLGHEMAHQFVDEVLGVHDEAAHGETFRQVCAARGIDGRAAGTPVPADGLASEADRVLGRIRKLLALAGSGNQHEAELAMKKAHELMLRHNLEVTATRTARSYEVRHLGDPRRRGTRPEAEVVSLLSSYFFVEVIRVPVYLPELGKRGAVYEILGSLANVEMAVHVYEFLLATAARLWEANRDDARIRSGRDRHVYQVGVIHGFRDKLAGERAELTGTGLVWRGDADLERYYHARHPRIAHTRGRGRGGEALEAGREAGREVVLHRPVSAGSSGGAPKLLGS
jgi:hypothetical protein